METARAEDRDLIDGGSTSRPPLVVYVHIPRTAGTTIGTVFANAYSDGGVLKAGNTFRSPQKTLARVRTLSALVEEEVRVVAGSVPYGALRTHLPKGSRYVTILREPVDRTLSHYYWLTSPGSRSEAIQKLPKGEASRSLTPPSPEVSLEQMLESDRYLLDNLATRMLSGQESPYGELPKDALERAKENLREGFAFVGMTERLEESIVLLTQLLGVDLVPYTSQKVNRERPRLEEVSKEERALIEQHNLLDLELYSFARDLFNRK